MEHQTSQLSPQELAAQKAYKISKENFRKQIKALAADQKELNLQLHRPHGSIANVGMKQTSKRLNRYELRHLHLAYAMTRIQYGGYKKNPKVSVDGISMKYIDKLMAQYGPKTVSIS